MLWTASSHPPAAPGVRRAVGTFRATECLLPAAPQLILIMVTEPKRIARSTTALGVAIPLPTSRMPCIKEARGTTSSTCKILCPSDSPPSSSVSTRPLRATTRYRRGSASAPASLPIQQGWPRHLRSLPLRHWTSRPMPYSTTLSKTERCVTFILRESTS